MWVSRCPQRTGTPTDWWLDTSGPSTARFRRFRCGRFSRGRFRCVQPPVRWGPNPLGHRDTHTVRNGIRFSQKEVLLTVVFFSGLVWPTNPNPQPTPAQPPFRNLAKTVPQESNLERFERFESFERLERLGSFQSFESFKSFQSSQSFQLGRLERFERLESLERLVSFPSFKSFKSFQS